MCGAVEGGRRALLQAGVDSYVIALWLGHESIETTKIYLHATLHSRRQPWRS
jgi:site-specific recombinase XerD